MPSSILLFVTAAIAFSSLLWLVYKRKSGRLPPGPTPLPIIGNVLDLPGKEPWVTLTQWQKKYGDICYVHVMGQGMIFLNSSEAAFELLERRGAIYSDRQRMVMAVELCGCDFLGLIGHGEKMRQTRRMMQRALGAPKIAAYHQRIELEAHALVQRLLSNPEDHIRHLQRFMGSLTVQVVYGHRVTSDNDRFLAMAKHMMELLSEEIVPAPPNNIWPVDVFPILKNLPSWAPFADFKRKAETWKAEITEASEVPYNDVKTRIREGTAIPCFCSDVLEDNNDLTSEQEKVIMWAANSIFAASVDTTETVLNNFILAMLLYPEKFSRARKEIDRVVQNRLPQFSDRPLLPYVECIMSELLRWAAPVPLNVPHMVMEDDIYEDYLIPKGSLVIANIMAMLRNEKLYPDPDTFIPERFEKLDEVSAKAMDPRQFVFGFGRRRCPGIHLAEATIWFVIMTLIATMDVSKALDQHGHVIEPEIKFENTVFRNPGKLIFAMKARTEQHARLIHEAVDKEGQ